MKKTLAMLLVLVMLFSLCACNNNDNQTTAPSDSSQSTTNGTENTTGNTENPTDGTEGTQPPTDEPTTPPTDEPTTPPTQAPTETPTTPPTTCSHSWKDATCTAPKTCTKCGATEGSASGHSWKNASCTAPKTCSKCGATEGSAKGHSYSNGSCSVCGTADPSFKQLTEGAWLQGTTILTFAEDGTWVAEFFYDDWLTMEEFYDEIEEYKTSDGGYIPEIDSWYTLFEVNGVRYASSPDYSSCGTYTVNGDTILLIDEDMGNDEMGAVRIDGDTLKLSKTENSNGWTNLVSGEHNWAAYQKLGVPSDYLD